MSTTLTPSEAVLQRVHLIPDNYFGLYGGGWGEKISLALIDAVYSISARYNAEPAPESVPEPAPESVPEPAPESVPEPAPEPAPESESNDNAEPGSKRRAEADEKPARGVSGRLRRLRATWNAAPDQPLTSLRALCTRDEFEIRRIMGNGKVAPGKPRSRYKSIAVLDAATAFTHLNIDSADDLRRWVGGIGDAPRDDAAFKRAKRAYTQVYGLGGVTFEYWLMLLGIPGVKADRRVVSFVEKSLSDARGDGAERAASLDARAARHLLMEAYDLWKVDRERRGHEVADLRAFDHAVWRFERDFG